MLDNQTDPPVVSCSDYGNGFARTSSEAMSQTAKAYNYAGEDYGRFADGDAPDDPATTTVRSAQADAILWTAICTSIDDVRRRGANTIRVLDAGCGPGTWLLRAAVYAHRIGLTIDALGFDISDAQVNIARNKLKAFEKRHPEANGRIEFMVHDIIEPLPSERSEFDVVLCNYVVLNHVPAGSVAQVVGELCRVARSSVIATVRALGGPPTSCITDPAMVRSYRYDGNHHELALKLQDGSEHRLTFNLYAAGTIKAYFAKWATVKDMRAVDLFTSRFASDPNWTPDSEVPCSGRADVLCQLKALEERLCRATGWIDHGTHVLIVAEPRHQECAESSVEGANLAACLPFKG